MIIATLWPGCNMAINWPFWLVIDFLSKYLILSILILERQLWYNLKNYRRVPNLSGSGKSKWVEVLSPQIELSVSINLGNNGNLNKRKNNTHNAHLRQNYVFIKLSMVTRLKLSTNLIWWSGKCLFCTRIKASYDT